MLWHAVANPSQTGEGRPRSTCVNTSNRGGPRDRRPGHPSDRTVRGTHRPGHPRTWPTPLRPRSSARGDRCRAGLPGRRPGAAALQRRTPLAAGRPHPGGAPVPPPAGPKRIQPAAQGPGAADGGRASVAGRQHPRFGRANPKLWGEREAVRQLLRVQPANRPPAGSAVVTDKGMSGQQTETFFSGLDLTLVRPARTDEHDPGTFPNWLRQRVEAIIWTLKHQLGLEAHGGRVPCGLWARIVQRLLALNAAIWHNWAIGAPVKRSLIAYDH